MVCCPMGRIDKGVSCSVSGCAQKAVRSVSSNLVERAKLRVEDSRHIYLCQTHYRELKKKTRKDQDIQRMRWNAES